eukprot:GHVR01049473.1.p1 GENE.GHVR01049473.1~~GHVR01049473.1.p1  ORF type:complete len:247 (-),score=78.94 GHVR01049473.1:107-847(-)
MFDLRDDTDRKISLAGKQKGKIDTKKEFIEKQKKERQERERHRQRERAVLLIQRQWTAFKTLIIAKYNAKVEFNCILNNIFNINNFNYNNINSNITNENINIIQNKLPLLIRRLIFFSSSPSTNEDDSIIFIIEIINIISLRYKEYFFSDVINKWDTQINKWDTQINKWDTQLFLSRSFMFQRLITCILKCTTVPTHKCVCVLHTLIMNTLQSGCLCVARSNSSMGSVCVCVCVCLSYKYSNYSIY